MKSLMLTLLQNFASYLNANICQTSIWLNMSTQHVELDNCDIEFIKEIMQGLVNVSKNDFKEYSNRYELYIHPMQDVLNILNGIKN
jgi:hypothetical protein